MITIHRSNGTTHRTDSLTYDEAMALAATEGAWFDIEVLPASAMWGSSAREKAGFPAASVTGVEQPA